MSGPEEDEPSPEPAPEPEPEPEAPEEEPVEPEPETPEEDPGEPEPEAPEEESGEPEPETPEEITGEPETPPGEESDSVQDLIDAIGDLNETITGAVTPEPEEQPPEGGGGGLGGEVQVTEPAAVDLAPVVQVLERNEKLLTHTNELLEQQSEVLATQHNDLLQLQANVDFVFLAVAALIGVVLGVAVGKLFHDLWRA